MNLGISHKGTLVGVYPTIPMRCIYIFFPKASPMLGFSFSC